MAELPAPTAMTWIVGSALLEHETDVPGFLKRLKRRLRDDSLRLTVIQLHGPKVAGEAIVTLEEAIAWTETACLVAEAQPRKRRRA